MYKDRPECITYIPSNHGGSLTSSTENSDFNAGVDINLRWGAEGAETYFLLTGYITCTHQQIHKSFK